MDGFNLEFDGDYFYISIADLCSYGNVVRSGSTYSKAYETASELNKVLLKLEED